MITKIPMIKKFGSFSHFDWDKTVRCPGNNIVEFDKLNIIYGRNYSGKTTLSRILRSIKKKALHEDYLSACFQVKGMSCGMICERDLADVDMKVRVYNSDFVTEHLRLLRDQNGKILPFAIVGSKNIELEKKIEKLTDEIGDENSGLRKELADASTKHERLKGKLQKADGALEESLKNKARDIKNASIRYDFPTYNIATIRKDIETVIRKPNLLSPEEKLANERVTDETVKADITLISSPQNSFSILIQNASGLLNKTVTPSQTIQHLIGNSPLQKWVRDGVSLHKDTRSTCAFCGNDLPDNLWDTIDAHFNKESEIYRSELNALITQIDEELDSFEQPKTISDSSFYSQFLDNYKMKHKELCDTYREYREILINIKSYLVSRKDDIFGSISFDLPDFDFSRIDDAVEHVNEILKDNNELTNSLDKQKEKARESLRLHEVNDFLNTINYDEKLIQIEDLKTKTKSANTRVQDIANDIISKEKEVLSLKSEQSDETKGAEQVNKYLRHYFGHDALALFAEKDDEGSRFVLKRGDNPAKNLSEGECSLVAFCYFMAKLQDPSEDLKDVIIWIDDPISSLDSNHTFFIYSIIENVLAKTKNYKQLFISTHSLDFLKYLKRITHPYKKIEGKRIRLTKFFILENDGCCSRLRPMPKYLEGYVTEFNYLFGIIYKCANSNEEDESFDYYYSFGNNLRKFLEAYLFYKYPIHGNLTSKMAQFFTEDNESTTLVNRVVQEYSHLEEVFDRSTKPIDVPEMKKIALYVLSKIEANDKDQYVSLLRSIDAPVEVA